MARFPELSENDLACLLESKNSENTHKKLKINKIRMIKQLLHTGYPLSANQNKGSIASKSTYYYIIVTRK
jgi:hypothetical protein